MTPRVALVVAIGLLLVGALGGVAIGAESSPVPIEPLLSGDPRSEGSGPGLVGNPLLILAAVVVLGVTTVAVTALLARLGQRG
jgi:hypothetical protein